MIRLLIILLLIVIILTLGSICGRLLEKTPKKKTNTFDEDLEKLAEKIKNK